MQRYLEIWGGGILMFFTPQGWQAAPGWAGTRKENQSGFYWSKRQWHQLGHMQVCTLLQTDNHASTPPLNGISWAICKFAPCSRQITMPVPHHSIFYRPDALTAAQPTASKHWSCQHNSMHFTVILYLTLKVKFVLTCICSVHSFTR